MRADECRSAQRGAGAADVTPCRSERSCIPPDVSRCMSRGLVSLDVSVSSSCVDLRAVWLRGVGRFSSDGPGMVSPELGGTDVRSAAVCADVGCDRTGLVLLCCVDWVRCRRGVCRPVGCPASREPQRCGGGCGVARTGVAARTGAVRMVCGPEGCGMEGCDMAGCGSEECGSEG